MRTLKQLIPYSALALGGTGIVLMLVPLTDSRIVANSGSQSLMSWGGICSLLGMITGIVLLIRRIKPQWAGVLGLVISIIPLLLFTVLIIALVAMGHDQ